MTAAMSTALVLIILMPAFAAGVSRLSENEAGALAKSGSAFSGVAFLLAVALAFGVASGGPASATINPGDILIGFHADRVVVILLLLVTGVSAVVQAFSGRYLRGDIRARRFFTGANLMTAATAAMVASVTFAGLAAAWSAAGLALLLLLGMYPGLPAAEEGLRRTRNAFLAGDLALWAAVLIAAATWGNLDLRSLDESLRAVSGDGFAESVVACLLVAAALSRSAQLPFRGWLPATVAVPTPVSALLHAGVVNGGGILLVQLNPVFGASSLATHLAFLAGASTAVYCTALMLSKPDVKGALAQSTSAQMGFMIMTCGLGAWAAAIFHLVAHGMFKASLFLGSGSAVARHKRDLSYPPVAGSRKSWQLREASLALALPGIVLLGATSVFYSNMTSASGGLLLFAWATGAWLTFGWLRRNAGVRGILIAAGTLAAAGSVYIIALAAASGFMAPALGEATASAVSPWWLGAFIILVPVAGLAGRRAGRLQEMRKTAYVWALGASQVDPAEARRRVRDRVPKAVSSGGLMPTSEGART